jgi:hypothetical protein
MVNGRPSQTFAFVRRQLLSMHSLDVLKFRRSRRYRYGNRYRFCVPFVPFVTLFTVSSARLEHCTHRYCVTRFFVAVSQTLFIFMILNIYCCRLVRRRQAKIQRARRTKLTPGTRVALVVLRPCEPKRITGDDGRFLCVSRVRASVNFRYRNFGDFVV